MPLPERPGTLRATDGQGSTEGTTVLTDPALPAPLALGGLLEASRAKYDSCLTHVVHSHSVPGAIAQLRFHHVKFDPDGEPKFAALAKVLFDHVIYYCVAAKNRPLQDSPDAILALFRVARSYFRQVEASGEAGEILLYLLLEAVLGAPQVVCKMELKGNPNVEVHGADGIHIAFDHERSCLNVYLGEAKLHQTLAGAISSVFASLKRLHAGGQVQHELRLVTNHFKFLDQGLREQVSTLLDDTHPKGAVRITHACLIGYDWKEYAKLNEPAERTLFVTEFADRYRKHGAQMLRNLTSQFAAFPKKHLAFEFFFLPFASVDGFRHEFNRVLFGGAP